MDTLSWARLGARVTGVDFAPEAIRTAQSLSKELKIPARFTCSDIYELPRRLKGSYDIVFTSYGVLCWLPDLPRWGRVVAHYLRPGGAFHLVESHPLTQLLDDAGTVPNLSGHGKYFNDGKPMSYRHEWSYADGKLDRKMTSIEWPFSLSEVVNALTGAGLQLDYLHEFLFEAWKRCPWYVKGGDGYWHPRRQGFAYPLMFSLKATKPQ
jgi:SAM-dependent methyltransferase